MLEQKSVLLFYKKDRSAPPAVAAPSANQSAQIDDEDIKMSEFVCDHYQTSTITDEEMAIAQQMWDFDG